jgi:flagellar motor switch protein FliN/FliY
MAETAQVIDQPAQNQAEQNQPAQAETKTQAQAADFPQAVDSGAAGSGSIDILLDMNIPVTVIIGKTQIPIRRLLQLAPGSVINLNKPIDAPMELYLKDTKFAAGNVVIVDGRFAVRIKQILSLGELKPNQPQE